MSTHQSKNSFSGRRMATVLVGRPEGQLGNRLFQAAAFLAASMEMGFPLWNPALGEYAGFFPELGGDFFCRPGRGGGARGGRLLFCKVVDALTGRASRRAWSAAGVSVLDVAQSHDAGEVEYDLCDREFEALLLRSRLVVAKGWKFRAHGALRARREEMVRIFTPQAAIRKQVAEGVARARSGADFLVGLHVRRGDYAGWLGGRYFYGLEEYADWMLQANALWPERKVRFLICSNEDVSSLLSLPGLLAAAGPGAPVMDLYALAACDYLIGPPSTFSLWASFHGGAPLQMLLERKQTIRLEGFAHHERF